MKDTLFWILFFCVGIGMMLCFFFVGKAIGEMETARECIEVHRNY